MAEEAIRCPHCQSETGVNYGTTSNGKARYRGQQMGTCGRTFIRVYAYPGRLPQGKRPIVEMTLNGSGVRDIARGLQVSPSTGIGELKKSPARAPQSTQVSWKGAILARSR